MMSYTEVLARFSVGEDELNLWIEQNWVRPVKIAAGWQFDDVDEARLSLICELRQTLEVNDDAMPVVLSLLDQLYAARNTLRHVRDALAALPDPAFDDIIARISAELDKG